MAVEQIRTCDVYQTKKARRYALTLCLVDDEGLMDVKNGGGAPLLDLYADLSDRAVKRVIHLMRKAMTPPKAKKGVENVGSNKAWRRIDHGG